jgi:hypothetical protein
MKKWLKELKEGLKKDFKNLWNEIVFTWFLIFPDCDYGDLK